MQITINGGTKQKKTFNVASSTFDTPRNGYYIKEYEIINVENAPKEKIREGNDFGLLLFLRDVDKGWDKIVNLTADMGTKTEFKCNWKITKLFESTGVVDAQMSFDKKEGVLKLSKQTIDSMIGKKLYGINYPYDKNKETGKLKHVTHYLFEAAGTNEEQNTKSKEKLETAFKNSIAKGYVKMYKEESTGNTPMVVPKIETSKPSLNLGGGDTDADEIPF